MADARRVQRRSPLGRTLEISGHREHGQAESLFALLLGMSWTRLSLSLFAIYLAVNLLFATIYWAMPGAVAGTEGSFADMYFFSVQTLATIGYGGLAPHGFGANAVVAVESFIGIMFSAVATGVAFAKFARPRARVLFSNVCTVHPRDGVPTLCFRVGNLRGVEIVEASVKISVLRTHVTAEGERMRRFTDLVLERDRTPLFVISWLVMHRIDASSPLYGVTPEALVADDARLFVSLTGVDDTYGQTIYARHGYDAADVIFDARFVDVLEPLPDGGTRIHFERFHDTVPMSDAARPAA